MPHRRNAGSFKPGAPPGPGRPKLTEEQRVASRQRAAERKQVEIDAMQACRDMLPLAAKVAKQLLGSSKTPPSVRARMIEWAYNRAYGMPSQAITGANGTPFVVTFQEILGKIDGAKTEKFGQV